MDTLPRDVTSVTKSEIEPFKQGRRVGCYLLGKTLGEGSFAKVKEGLHIITGEKVAVKIIDKKRAREDRYISKNLRREARIHQLVRHPNIIQLYEVLETDHFYYLVMEYCAGGELLDYICTRKRLEETVAKRIVAQLVSAVDGMHKSGVVHRDLKIENFLLNDNEDLKIIDFGLSNTLSLDAMQEYERTGVFPQLLNTHCGSPAYAAPELLAQKKYGPQVDVWSIGINMYAMLTGFLPYMMEPFNVMEMYEKMMQRRMTPIPGFLSKPCRDLLMRLLEPVADWRITLKQVMKHKWFSDSIHVPRSIPLGDMMYQKKELCESVLSYMKYNLKVRTKDTINAVVSNRAVHASAVYHLLVARLDRHLKEKKENIELNKQFAKVEVIKKSNLSTDNFHKASVPTSRSKRFTFRGKKIDGNNLSQQNLADNNELDNDNEHVNEDGLSANDDSVKYVQNKKESMKLKDEHASNSASNVIHSVPSPSDALEPQDQNLPQRNAPHRGHRRALSSVNPNEIRQAGEIHSTLRNSLCSDSKEDLSDITAQTPEQQPRSESPEDPFGKTGKGIVSRKISFDVRIGDLGSPNNGDKSIDVAKFLPESPKTSTSEKNKAKRKVSVDYPINESNVKEKKEPIPGWLITKIIKQPPLKEEPTNIQEQRSASVSPTSVDSVSSERNSPEYLGGDSENSKTQKKTIRRPETPEKLRESQRSDLNDNNNSIDDNDDESTDSNRSSVSDRLHTFMKNNLPNNAPGFQEKTGKHDNPKYPKDSNEISDAVVNELLNNVRNITENYLKDNEEEKSRRKITEQHSNNISKKDSSTQSSKTPSPPLNISSDSLNTGRSTSRTSSTKSPDSLDENNNNTNNVARNSKTKDDKKTQKINTKTLRNNSIRGRILALENYEQKIRNKRTAKAEANSVSPIKKITISKKTLELNVKQFQQFKADQKSETANLHSNIHSNNNRVPNRFFYTENTVNHNKLITSPKSPLKPLELKFDFQRRKKKVYKDRQQTRSLTDVTNGILGKVDTKPKEEQMLIPKHRCNNNCTEADGCCKGEDTSMEKDLTEIRSVYDSSGTINIEADNNSVSVEERQPTMKITAHNTNNRTKIFLSAKKTTSVSIPTNQDNVVVTSPIKNNNISHEKHLTDSDNSSFDSGYFGTNSFPPAYEEFHSTITKESAGHNLDSIVEATEKMKKQPMEIHSVKYRCIPVYQLEYMKTGTIHNKDQLDVIIEENNRYRNRQDEAGFIHRKWGSQTIEPTQDPVDYIPRPAEIIINTREKFQKERLKKMEQLKTESRRLDFMTRSKSVDNSPSLDYNRIRTQKQQFPSDTSVINDSSPKYNRQSTYGTVNRNRTAPATPCTSPTVCDRTIEKQKILAFTHALETAAWRKRSVLSATN